MEVEKIARITKKKLKDIGMDEFHCVVNLTPKHDGSFHIEKDSFGKYHIIVTERGQVTHEELFDNEEDVIFRIYESNTFDYAARWEAKNRIEEQDFRILLFTKHLQLLEMINDNYVERLFPKYKKILGKFSYGKYA